MRTPSISDEQKALARKLGREGKSCRAIAREVGISNTAAWNLIAADNNQLKADEVPASKNIKAAKPVVTHKTKITIHKQQIPDYAPICATTTKGTYRTNGALSYRGSA